MRVIRCIGMREFKHGVGVIALQKLLNLLLFKMFEKSLTKVDFRSKNQKDMSGDAVIAVFSIKRPSIPRTKLGI